MPPPCDTDIDEQLALAIRRRRACRGPRDANARCATFILFAAAVLVDDRHRPPQLDDDVGRAFILGALGIRALDANGVPLVARWPGALQHLGIILVRLGVA